MNTEHPLGEGPPPLAPASAAPLPPASVKKKGCSGCFRKGCGFFALLLVLCIAVALLPLSCGISPPSAYAYFPSETMFAYRSEFVEFAEGRVHPNLSVEFREWALGYAQRAEQKPASIVHLNLDQKLSQVVILQLPSAATVVGSAKASSQGTEDLGNHRLYLFDNKPSQPEMLAIAAITDSLIAAGDAAAVRRILAVASGQEVSLFDARPDLRPLLSTFSTSQSVVFTFQPLEIAEGTGCLGKIFGPGNPLFSLIDVRGHAFGSRKDDQQCTVSIAFQYANRVPSTLVSSVFGAFSIFNTIPVGIPEDLGQPTYMDAEQERGMAILTAGFDVQKCEEVDRKNRNP